jgi:hypothetical protein
MLIMEDHITRNSALSLVKNMRDRKINHYHHNVAAYIAKTLFFLWRKAKHAAAYAGPAS